jgi:hypothetical protein
LYSLLQHQTGTAAAAAAAAVAAATPVAAQHILVVKGYANGKCATCMCNDAAPQYAYGTNMNKIRHCMEDQ